MNAHICPTPNLCPNWYDFLCKMAKEILKAPSGTQLKILRDESFAKSKNGAVLFIVQILGKRPRFINLAGALEKLSKISTMTKGTFRNLKVQDVIDLQEVSDMVWNYTLKRDKWHLWEATNERAIEILKRGRLIDFQRSSSALRKLAEKSNVWQAVANVWIQGLMMVMQDLAEKNGLDMADEIKAWSFGRA